MSKERELQTRDYKGPERRNGGNSLRMSRKDKLWIISIITPIVIGVIGWFYITNYRLDAFADEDETIIKRIEKNEKKGQKQNDDILTIQSDISYIKEEQKEMKIQIQENHTETMKVQLDTTKLLHEVLGKLGN